MWTALHLTGIGFHTKIGSGLRKYDDLSGQNISNISAFIQAILATKNADCLHLLTPLCF